LTLLAQIKLHPFVLELLCSFVGDSCCIEQFSWRIEQFDDDGGSGGECE
jgi:hypothetical protein